MIMLVKKKYPLNYIHFNNEPPLLSGWNPFYNNEKRTIETHVLHDFKEDFYGRHLRVAITGFIRPEKNYDSVDKLVEDIHNDIRIAKERLEKEEHQVIKQHDFFARSPQAGAS